MPTWCLTSNSSRVSSSPVNLCCLVRNMLSMLLEARYTEQRGGKRLEWGFVDDQQESGKPWLIIWQQCSIISAKPLASIRKSDEWSDAPNSGVMWSFQSTSSIFVYLCLRAKNASNLTRLLRLIWTENPRKRNVPYQMRSNAIEYSNKKIVTWQIPLAFTSSYRANCHLH